MHIPVLKEEVLKFLSPVSNENFVDCTINGGGHALAILERNGPKGNVLGIDQDQGVIDRLRIKIKDERLILVCENFINLKKIVEENNFKSVSGILLDLGMSSWQLDEGERGFSFLKDEPLIMKYNENFDNKLTAEEIINTYLEKDIEKILEEYGEEKFAKRIAKKIIEERERKQIKTTFQLLEVIKRAIPYRSFENKKHFATRTFQALRMEVNDELNNLKNVLPQALEILDKKGRLAVISFHSLEDRIVKNFLKENYNNNYIEILNKKPITSSVEEIKKNNRSRSAKLRVAIKK